MYVLFFFSSRRRHTIGALVTGVQTCALPIYLAALEGERVGRLVLLGPGGFALPRGEAARLRRLEAGMGQADTIAVHRHNLAALMIADPEKADDLAVYIQVENVRRARTRAGDIPLSDTLLRVLPRIRARLNSILGGREASVSHVHSVRQHKHL